MTPKHWGQAVWPYPSFGPISPSHSQPVWAVEEPPLLLVEAVKGRWRHRYCTQGHFQGVPHLENSPLCLIIKMGECFLLAPAIFCHLSLCKPHGLGRGMGLSPLSTAATFTTSTTSVICAICPVSHYIHPCTRLWGVTSSQRDNTQRHLGPRLLLCHLPPTVQQGNLGHLSKSRCNPYGPVEFI